MKELIPIPPAPDEPGRGLSEVPVRRPPLWGLSSVVLTLLGTAILLEVVMVVGAALWSRQPLRPVLLEHLDRLLLIGLSAGLMLRRWYVRSRPLEPIRFHEEFVDLPSLHGTRRRRVPYLDILYMRLGGYPPNLRLMLESPQDLFFFDQPSFFDPSGPELVFLELRRRILRLPQGRRLLEAMQRRETMTGRALATRPWATHTLLGILVVIYLNQLTTGLSLLWAVSWGAVAPTLIAKGELYRLLSANFLHLHPLHLLLNGIALFSLGGVMERFLGWERYLVVYLVSGLGATLASTLFTDAWGAAGASGSILGLFGGLAVVNIKYGKALPLGFFRQSKRWWFFIVTINAALPILLPIVDVAGHLGGLLVGAATTALLLEPKEPATAPPAGSLVRTLALALIGMYAVGVGTAVWLVRSTDQARLAHYATLFGEDARQRERIDPTTANELAWTLAIYPGSTPAQLALAEELAQRAMRDEAPPIPVVEWYRRLSGTPESTATDAAIEYQDTLATVFFRQGRFGEAARQEMQALAARPESPDDGLLPWAEIWSQLERFLAAAVEREGPIVLVPVDPFALEIERPRGKPPQLALRLRPPPGTPVTVYALARRGARRLGLLRIHVGSDPPESLVHRPDTSFALTEDVVLAIAAVRPESPEDVPPGAARWYWHPIDARVAEYP